MASFFKGLASRMLQQLWQVWATAMHRELCLHHPLHLCSDEEGAQNASDDEPEDDLDDQGELVRPAAAWPTGAALHCACVATASPAVCLCC